MTERFDGEVKKGPIRSEHDELIARLEKRTLDKEDPAIIVGPGANPNEVMVYIDLPKASLNDEEEPTTIEQLEKWLEDPKKPWRGPQEAQQKEKKAAFKRKKLPNLFK